MNTPNHPAPTPPHPTVRQPTNPRQNRNAFYIAVVGALIALVAVIAFNLKAPKGRLDAPGQASSVPSSQGPQQTGGPAGQGSVQSTSPQAGDTPTGAARDAMGAPAGAVPASN